MDKGTQCLDGDDVDWLRKLFLVVRRCEWTFYFNAEGAVPKEKRIKIETNDFL